MIKQLKLQLAKHFPELNYRAIYQYSQLHIDIVGVNKLLEVLEFIKTEPILMVQQLIDLTAVDYLDYGIKEAELSINQSKVRNYSAMNNNSRSMDLFGHNLHFRFGIVYQFLSLTNNLRIKLQFFLLNNNTVDSCIKLWPIANWYEREIFDLFGINFVGHINLTRILNQTNFNGHPFRKDFFIAPTIETKFDPKQQKIVSLKKNHQDNPEIPKQILRQNTTELV